MIRRIGMAALVLAVGYGLVTWIGEPGNGNKVGRTGGELANTVVDGTGGVADVVTGFIDGLNK